MLKRITFIAVLALFAGLLTGLTTPAQAFTDRDCGDFSTQSQAQTFYNNNRPSSDPHGLDADDDGRACDSLPCPCGATSGGGGGGDSTGGGGNATLKQRARVIRVVDGDTYKARLASGPRVTVRMIGIDTPELSGDECGSRAAKRSLKQSLPRGTRVLLVSDPTQQLKDRYGRVLRYTRRERDGKDINHFQVWKGWARVYVYNNDPFQRVSSYRTAQRRAQGDPRGVWRTCR